MDRSRRALLVGLGFAGGAGLAGLFRLARGSVRETTRLRPPGALPEDEFLSACIRCGQCVVACPYDTLKLDTETVGAAAGTPFLQSRTVPCFLCEDFDELLCIKACPSAALRPVDDIRDIRMGTAVIDEEICHAFNGVICRSCWHACPLPDEAIVLDPMLRPVVDPKICIGCGLCDHACPTEETSIPIRPAGAPPGSAPG